MRKPLWLIGLALGPLAAQADVGAATTVASGLANPRGIAFAPNGELYVAEAGSGGPGPCTPSPVPPNLPRCYGETGAVTHVVPDVGFTRVLTGLPSLALPDGTVEGGPVDVAFFGTAAHVTLGLGGDPRIVRPAIGNKAPLLGTVLHMAASGEYKVVADIAAQEAAYNPAGGAVDSNPYNTLVLPGRRVVADAGANALFEVRANGATSTFALPAIAGGRQPVPTSVVEGPDGAVYVGLLTQFPFFPGSAPVLRISSDGSSTTIYAAGFTAIVDLAFDTGGALYVLEVARGQQGPLPPPNPGLGIGRLVRQCSDGSRSVLLEGLTYPAGVAIGPDGAVYLTNKGTSRDQGEVLKLVPTPCP